MTTECQDETKKTSFIKTWFNYFSPFEFQTLKEFPFPIWTILFTSIFFAVIWNRYEKNVDNSSIVSGEISDFVKKERSNSPLKPEICAVGASITGMGIERNVLSQKLKCNVAKIALGNNTIRETSNIIKKYENEFRNTKIIIVEYQIFNIRKDTRDPIKQRFRFLKNIFDTKYTYMQLTWAEMFLPIRFSIRDIKKNINIVFDGKSIGHEAIWTSSSYAKLKEHYTNNIQKNITVFREREKNGVQNVNFPLEQLEESLISEAMKLLEYCRTKGIFVIFSVYPGEISRHFPCGNKLSSIEYKYLASIRELQNQPDCAVIIADNFNDILLEPRDYEKKPALTFDNAHMTHEGAEVYTNWLADQMLNDLKVMTALKTPRKKETYIAYLKKTFRPYVGNDVKKAYRTFAGIFKKQKIKEQKNIKIAQPTTNPVR
jgi:hypothetical protein